MTTNHSWQESYEAAMLELDPASLPARIEAAQAAIQQAMQDLPGTCEHEIQEMCSAMGNLQSLQRVTLRASMRPSGISSDRGATYATLVPQDSSADLAQTAVGDDGTASSRESRDRSKPAGVAGRQSCQAESADPERL